MIMKQGWEIKKLGEVCTIVSYVCVNGDITKEVVLNDSPFDERLSVFSSYMIPLGRYIDNIHNVIIPKNSNDGFAS